MRTERRQRLTEEQQRWMTSAGELYELILLVRARIALDEWDRAAHALIECWEQRVKRQSHTGEVLTPFDVSALLHGWANISYITRHLWTAWELNFSHIAMWSKEAQVNRTVKVLKAQMSALLRREATDGEARAVLAESLNAQDLAQRLAHLRVQQQHQQEEQEEQEEKRAVSVADAE